jgi:glycosyltransferase involved in cell wall biosynthesis
MPKNKIGIGIITCNRPHYFYECIKSIDKNIIGSIVVVNDGKDLNEEIKEYLNNSNIHYILNEKNLGVSKTKNKALKYLLEQDCEHIFVLEDDCIIGDNNVWNKYIKAYEVTGIPHFNFGPGSPWNRKQDDPSIIGDLSKRQLAKQNTSPNPKLTVQHKDGVVLCMYEHIVAMFTYFHNSILKEVGFLDEEFYNAWEHVEHTYRIIKAGKYTPFWWFADIEGSENYIKEAENEKANTSLASNEEKFMKQVQEGLQHFYKLHNTVPSHIRAESKEEVIKTVKKIYDNRSKNN